MATGHKTAVRSGAVREVQQPDGLSMGIHSKEDADLFMSQLKALKNGAK